MQDDKKKVETILFTTGNFLGLEDISRLVDISDLKYLEKVIGGLVEDYAGRDCALEIVRQGNKWKLSIRKEYLHFTEKLLKDCELDRPTQETLAVIAYKNPVLQSDVIKIRGNKAYDHISNLRGLDFITAEKFGRTRMLKVTQRFYDYFDVVAEQLKSKFEGVIPEAVKEKLDKMSEESMKEALQEGESLNSNEKEEKEVSTEAFEDCDEQLNSNNRTNVQDEIAESIIDNKEEGFNEDVEAQD